MRPFAIVLAVLAAALGAAGGFAGGYVVTVIYRVHTDIQVGCALLQTAETAGYLTRERRGQLVDKVVPALPKDAPPRTGGSFIADVWWDRRAFAEGWWDSIREDQKSGCRGM